MYYRKWISEDRTRPADETGPRGDVGRPQMEKGLNAEIGSR